MHLGGDPLSRLVSLGFCEEGSGVGSLRTACYRNNGSAAATASGVIDGVSSGCGEDCSGGQDARHCEPAIVATLIVYRAVELTTGSAAGALA